MVCTHCRYALQRFGVAAHAIVFACECSVEREIPSMCTHAVSPILKLMCFPLLLVCAQASFPRCTCAFSATSWFMCSQLGGADINRSGAKPKAGGQREELAASEAYRLHVAAFPGDAEVCSQTARMHVSISS